MFLKSPPDLILASTSTYRRQLLERLQVPFTTGNPGVDESRGAGEAPRSLAARLALAKATALAVRHPQAWVIGSDQVAHHSDPEGALAILGKPGTRERCIEQLMASSGRTVEFLTAVAVMRQRDGALHQFIDETRVRFRLLDRATIERYVDAESPLDCAGGFRSEGLGIALFEAIESTDPSALVGLPLIRLAAVLRTAGFSVP